MNSSEWPDPETRAKISCFMLGLLILTVVIILWIGAALGDCAPNADGTGCEYDGLKRFVMFPGSVIVGALLMVSVAYRTFRNRD